MIINRARLIDNGLDDASRILRKDTCIILEAALRAVDPEQAIFNALKMDGETLRFSGGSIDFLDIERVLVLGGGKAGGLMARAVETLFGDRIEAGVINVLEGTENKVNLKKIGLNGASHPVPSKSGVEGVEKMLALTQDLSEKDLVFALISGGGSALMPYPAEKILLTDIQEITERLLKAGATINELNSVRKHLSGFKGGQLARHCMPARVVSLVLSDVIGDPLDIIASGPTAPDSSSFLDAKYVLEKYGLWSGDPENVQARIADGVDGSLPDTPKDDDPIFKKVYNVLIANNPIAVNAAKSKAEKLGYNSMILSTFIEGEARQVGELLSGIAREINTHDRPVSKPAAIVMGGETTVTVNGDGVGGRNMEVGLAAASKIDGISCLIAGLATDGIDGPTESAGGIVDGYTLERSSEKKLNPVDFLEDNNSYRFFEALGDYIKTGPTGTNVNDLSLILVR